MCLRETEDQTIRLSFGGKAIPISSPKRRDAPNPPHSTTMSAHRYCGDSTKDGSRDQRSCDPRVTFKEDPAKNSLKLQDQHDLNKTKQISRWLSQVSHRPSHHTPSHHPPTHHTSSLHTMPMSHHPPTQHTPSHTMRTTTRHPPPSRVLPSNRNAYLREDEITFPPTKPGAKSTIKVQVCNRNIPRCKFTVIKLGGPFSVDHWTFDLG